MDLWSKLTITKLTKNISITWPGTTNVDMKDFFELTSPSYYIYHCQFEQIDCRMMWKKVMTLNGVCLEFDPLTILQDNQRRTAQNKVKDIAFEFGYGINIDH